MTSWLKKAYEAEVSELSLMTASLREELKLNDDSTNKIRVNMQHTIDNLENKCSNCYGVYFFPTHG